MSEVQAAPAGEMKTAETETPPGVGDLLAIGLGTTVAMWSVAYVAHMPLVHLPPTVSLWPILACLAGGGWVFGRYTQRPLGAGAWVGVIAAVLNLMILGSLLRPAAGGLSGPAAALWLPGTLAASVALVMAGALLGRRRPARRELPPNWAAALAWLTCLSALLLITAGGLVTGFRAGLAVPDWPGSFGFNMFLLPLSRMTGGVFYEHAHRLLGALVGLATLILAVYLSCTRRRRGVIALVWLIGVCVAAQGVMGGLRVTEDNYALAVIHGLFAHAILAGLVLVAVVVSRGANAGDCPHFRPKDVTTADEVQRRKWGLSPSAPPATTDRILTVLLVSLLLGQTLLGVLLRQLGWMLMEHVCVAAFVVLAGVGVGMRAWGLNGDVPTLRRAGAALMFVVLVQIALGVGAIIVRSPPLSRSPTAEALESGQATLPVAPAKALLTTAHQANAAALLCLAAFLAAWTWRGDAPRNSNCVIRGGGLSRS